MMYLLLSIGILLKPSISTFCFPVLFLLVGVVVYCKNWDHYLVRRNCHIEPGMYRVYLERLRWSYVLLCLVLLVILIIVVFSVAIEQTIMQTPQTARRGKHCDYFNNLCMYRGAWC